MLVLEEEELRVEELVLEDLEELRASVTMRKGETDNNKAFIYKFVINLDDSIVTTFERTSVNTRTRRGRGATRGGASAMTRGGAHSIDGTINTCLFM